MPLAIDLYAGLGGWTDGLLAEGWDVVGFDIERHQYGDAKYQAQLVLQDVLTLHGSQFRNVDLIVASPPCQEFSYMAMPWSIAKEKERRIAADPEERKRLTALFDACFRIQREACEASGRHIPLIVENVRGAQKWVGRSRWNYGSFHLWGDVPALMPMTKSCAKVPGLDWNGSDKPGYKAEAFNTTAESRLRDERKNNGGSWFNVAHNTTSGHGQNPDGRKLAGFRFDGSGRSMQSTAVEQTKGANGGWFNDNKRSGKSDATGYLSQSGSKSNARKAASAHIARIPFPLAAYIARTFYPRAEAA